MLWLLRAIICNATQELLTMSCVFCSIVPIYVIQGQGSLDVTITASIKSQFREILTGSVQCQGIDERFCNNVFNTVIVTVTTK